MSRLLAGRITFIIDGQEIVWEFRDIVAVLLMVLALVAEHQLGVRPTFWTVVWTLLAVILISRPIGRHSSQRGGYLAAELDDLASMPREPGKVTHA